MKRGLTIVFAALVIRLAFVWQFSTTYPNKEEFLYADAYSSLAVGLAERGEFSIEPGIPSLDRPPGFPLIIAIIFKLFGSNPYLVLVLNAMLSAATCGMLYILGRRLFSERVGLMSAVFWAGYPYAIYYCGWAIRESLMCLLAAGLLWCLLEWRQKRSAAWGAACGVLGAYMALVNPIVLVFVGLAPLTVFAPPRSAAVFYAVLGILYAPWPLRNWRVFGVPVVTNIHGGKQFYQGMLVAPDDFGTPAETATLKADPKYARGLEMMEAKQYIAANRWFNEAGWNRVAERPSRYLGQVAHRVLKLWRLVPYQRTYTHDYRKIFWASLLSDGLIIPLGLVGIFTFRERWRELLPFYAMLALWTLAYALVFVVIRFRLPVMTVMTVFAMAAVDRRFARRPA